MSFARGFAPVRLRELVPWTALLVMTGLLLLAGCSEDDDSNTGPDDLPAIAHPMIDSVNVPELWVLHSETYRTVSVTLSLTEEEREAVLQRVAPRPRVYLSLEPLPPFGGIVLELKDDGGVASGDAPVPFVSEGSGDVVPGDFTYSLRMNTTFADAEGTVEYDIFVFSEGEFDLDATDRMTDLRSSELTIRANQAPVITEVLIPDSLHAGFDEDNWRVTVEDNDPSIAGIVDSVSLELLRDDVVVRRVLFSRNGGDETWNLRVDSTFAAGYPTDTYLFRIGAIDRFESRAEPVEQLVWMENSPPITTNLAAPDTVVRPLEGENVYEFILEATDSQGQGDISEVFYEVLAPGTSQWFRGEDFLLQDNGTDPDTTAGDGIWTGGFVTVPENSNFGTYQFRFFAEDRAENLSEEIVTEIEFVDSPGGDQ